jgi:hypothetical protein
MRVRVIFNREEKKQNYRSRVAQMEKEKKDACAVSLATKNNHHTLFHSTLPLPFIFILSTSSADLSRDSLCFFSYGMLLAIDVKHHLAVDYFKS